MSHSYIKVLIDKQKGMVTINIPMNFDYNKIVDKIHNIYPNKLIDYQFIPHGDPKNVA